MAENFYVSAGASMVEPMKLFEDKERTHLEPKRPGEDDYSFYDFCALPGYDDYRARLNGWLEEMPESAQKDLLPRFRKNESLEYQRALASSPFMLPSNGRAIRSTSIRRAMRPIENPTFSSRTPTAKRSPMLR